MGLARLRVFDALAACSLLQQAVALDPKFSLAHSALAEAWSRLGYDKNAKLEARQAYDLSANLSREERLLVEGRYRVINHENDEATDVYRTLFTLFPDNLDYGLKLAAEQSASGKGNDALATIAALHKLAPPASEDARLEWEEAKAWGALSDFNHQEPTLERTVEMATAQGSRLILANAREAQCWVFTHLEQEQNAVAACREARDIYAATGDHLREAGTLTKWADAIARTDVPESIRLYQQAQTIDRRNGSENGAAVVLNNLGLIYEAQGDLATAERMHRQSLAGFRLLDDKRYQAVVSGNIAEDRMEQGDLRGAIQLYEQALQLNREDTGNVAFADYGIANVHQLQGDLERAKQGFEESLALTQKYGDQDWTANAMWSLGNLSLQEADFVGARKMYEQALTIRTSAGEKLSIAETQLALASVSLEKADSPVEQEAMIRQAIEVFQQQKARDDEIVAWGLLARALLAEGRGAAAKEAVQHARPQAAKSQNPEIRWRTAITADRIETAGKNHARSALQIAARRELALIAAKSKELGYKGIELDARLALAEIEMKAGQTAAGRARWTRSRRTPRPRGTS